jgi:serine/threonine protein kinase
MLAGIIAIFNAFLIYPPKLRGPFLFGMKRLVAHGFLDIELNEKLSNICEAIPHARAIARLGREQHINSESWRFLDRSLESEGRYVGWHIGQLYREGTYGKIFKAFRMIVERRPDRLFDVVESPHEVIVKQTLPPVGSTVLPAEDVTAHTSEALLHVLAWQTIQTTATPWAIPRPYEVFGDCVAGSEAAPEWRSMSLCMSYVHGRTLYSYIQKHWRTNTKEANARSFVEILAQVAYILFHLQREMRLNHRDVKVNNILVRQRRSPVVLDLDGYVMVTRYEVTLIDFGFACVGCPPPREPMTVFQAGSWFPFGELCCKVGRDLAQLMYCIHCYFPLAEYLPSDIMDIVRVWMQIPWSGGVADGLRGFTKEGRPRRAGAVGAPEYNTGIYEFLRRPDVDPALCDPQAIFKECVRLQAKLA